MSYDTQLIGSVDAVLNQLTNRIRELEEPYRRAPLEVEALMRTETEQEIARIRGVVEGQLNVHFLPDLGRIIGQYAVPEFDSLFRSAAVQLELARRVGATQRSILEKVRLISEDRALLQNQGEEYLQHCKNHVICIEQGVELGGCAISAGLLAGAGYLGSIGSWVLLGTMGSVGACSGCFSVYFMRGTARARLEQEALRTQLREKVEEIARKYEIGLYRS